MMQSFILGYPKSKPQIEANVCHYQGTYQDAVSGAVHAVEVYAENLDKAKEIFFKLAKNNYMPLPPDKQIIEQTNPAQAQPQQDNKPTISAPPTQEPETNTPKTR